MNCRKQNNVDPFKWETTILPIRWAGSWDKGFPAVYPGKTVQGHTATLAGRLVQLNTFICTYYTYVGAGKNVCRAVVYVAVHCTSKCSLHMYMDHTRVLLSLNIIIMSF